MDSFELLESRENEIFKIFVSQHKKSKGEKGKFMTENVEAYFEDLQYEKASPLYIHFLHLYSQ